MPDSSLAAFDAQLAASASMTVLGAVKISFQFAPRVVSDSNSSEWLEQDLWGIEPLKIHKGSGGRKLTVEWEYIATDNQFSASNIATILRGLKSYFFLFKRGTYPVVKFKFSEVVPDAMNFRMMNCQITHGPEMVMSGGKFYPLYSKVSVNLELATKINVPGEPPKVSEPPLLGAQATWY